MKTSFVQIFDKEDDAKKALGFITGAFPKHKHSLSKSSNQVQIWATLDGKKEHKTYGDPNAEVTFLVTSVAPD
jgi:hypothetical protein